LSNILDKEAADIVQSHLEEQGIEFFLEDTIEKFIGEKKVKSVRLKSGQKLYCDFSVIAVGVRPNKGWLENTDIKINQGILVNKKLQTSSNNIYAAGDVSEGYNMLTGSSAVIPVWPNAYNQGFVAGQNMSGKIQNYDDGFARNSISFFELPIITAGVINPPENEDYETYVFKSINQKTFKKVLIKNNKIKGFICINSIDRIGILTGLIKEQKNIQLIKDRILTDDFGLLCFEKEYRTQKLLKT